MARAAIKRLMAEYQALTRESDRAGDIYARPLDDNIFEWHFTILGPRQNCTAKESVPVSTTVRTRTPSTEAMPDEDCVRPHKKGEKEDEGGEGASPYSHGIYHGRLLFPRTYPLEPPDIIFLTPNGRFETNKKICSSISSFHKETWRPSYDIRFTLLSLRLFMAQEDEQGVGAIPTHAVSVEAKRRLARESWSFTCPACQAQHHDDADTVTKREAEGRESNDARATTEAQEQIAAADGQDKVEPSRHGAVSETKEAGRQDDAKTGWCMAVLYEKVMKPYQETSMQAQSTSTLGTGPMLNSSSSSFVPATCTTGSAYLTEKERQGKEREREDEEALSPSLGDTVVASGLRSTEVTAATFCAEPRVIATEGGAAVVDEAMTLTPFASPLRPACLSRTAAAEEREGTVAASSVVIIRVHHLVYAVALRVLWRVVVTCICIIVLIQARRGFFFFFR